MSDQFLGDVGAGTKSCSSLWQVKKRSGALGGICRSVCRCVYVGQVRYCCANGLEPRVRGWASNRLSRK